MRYSTSLLHWFWCENTKWNDTPANIQVFSHTRKIWYGFITIQWNPTNRETKGKWLSVHIIGMSILSGSPNYRGVCIIGTSVLSGCSYYRGVRIIGTSVLSECTYYRNVRIIGVSELSGCPYYRNVRIIGMLVVSELRYEVKDTCFINKRTKVSVALEQSFHLCRPKNDKNLKPQPERKTFRQKRRVALVGENCQ